MTPSFFNLSIGGFSWFVGVSKEKSNKTVDIFYT